MEIESYLEWDEECVCASVCGYVCKFMLFAHFHCGQAAFISFSFIHFRSSYRASIFQRIRIRN